MGKTIAILGSLDTKGPDYAFIKALIEARGHTTLVIDTGVIDPPHFEPDVDRAEVAEAGGSAIETLQENRDRGEAMKVMSTGAAVVVQRLYEEGRFDGIISMAGSGGTSVATAAMRALPVGVPKLMVSTVASGDVGAYVGTRDITMMPSVVDVAGLNQISRRVYANAAGAICGMVETEAPEAEEKPLIVASMFGNTTPAVNRAKETMEAHGYEVLVFHATGTGGKTMEALIEDGFIDGVLDITTTEWADEVCGGVLSAGPTRLEAAARTGTPQIVVPGCIDMANFWAPDTVPEQYRDRNLYEWNPNVTLLRTNVEENRQMGRIFAEKLNRAQGPVAVFIPLKGVSMLDSEGERFWDPEADRAFREALKADLRDDIPVYELEYNINDPEFVDALTEKLLEFLGQT
ncbi:MAG: Tm-1-like ATP-binding domain-containing protein [Anaerolineae bacterium]